MDDGSRITHSFIENLKLEWTLFWDSLVGEDDSAPEDLIQNKLESLSLEQIKKITKSLSSDRKLLNQQLESVKKEIDLNSAKLETLILVGADSEDTMARIVALNDLGQGLSEQLEKLDHKLKLTRRRETELIESLKLGKNIEAPEGF